MSEQPLPPELARAAQRKMGWWTDWFCEWLCLVDTLCGILTGLQYIPQLESKFVRWFHAR